MIEVVAIADCDVGLLSLVLVVGCRFVGSAVVMASVSA